MHVSLIKIIEKVDNHCFRSNLAIFLKETTITHMPQIGMIIILNSKTKSYFQVDDITETAQGRLVLFHRQDVWETEVKEKYPKIRKALENDGWRIITKTDMYNNNFLTTGYLDAPVG